tara:strand:+ start:932 stop:1333 length:402 start_codon:yes stop_codon:yes gene_type:complete
MRSVSFLFLLGEAQLSIVSAVIAVLVAAIHLFIVWLEMFAWESRGPKVFRGLPKDMFAPTKAMAANQGLYNGFLAAGLIWSLMISNPVWQSHIALFFFGCVAAAGIYGAVTVSRRIFYVQALPALLGIVSLMF